MLSELNQTCILVVCFNFVATKHQLNIPFGILFKRFVALLLKKVNNLSCSKVNTLEDFFSVFIFFLFNKFIYLQIKAILLKIYF